MATPLGGNAGPDMANVYLFMYELWFLPCLANAVALSTTAADLERYAPYAPAPPVRAAWTARQAMIQQHMSAFACNLLDNFAFTRRFVDDITSISNRIHLHIPGQLHLRRPPHHHHLSCRLSSVGGTASCSSASSRRSPPFSAA